MTIFLVIFIGVFFMVLAALWWRAGRPAMACFNVVIAAVQFVCAGLLKSMS